MKIWHLYSEKKLHGKKKTLTKRSISQNQRRRVEKSQADYLDLDTLKQGLVISCYGRFAIIETAEKKRLHCSIRQNLPLMVAGDNIVWRDQGKNQGVIVSLKPRQSVLTRLDKAGKKRPVAANLTQIVIVVAPKPALSWYLLDSYLVMAESLGIPPLIVLNKIDLDSTDLKKALQTIYHPLGYKLVFTSREDISQLVQELENQVSVFVGQSGVGKSSLIRHILPENLEIRTNTLSIRSELGQHTTSNSKWYHLSQHQAALIDSPGIRELSLAEIPVRDLMAGFPEFRELSRTCKYRNCSHQDSLGCAIIKSVRENQQLSSRYQSLLQILTIKG